MNRRGFLTALPLALATPAPAARPLVIKLGVNDLATSQLSEKLNAAWRASTVARGINPKRLREFGRSITVKQ